MAHILLVEDDRNIVQSLTDLLEHEGYTVTTAGTQADALARLAAEPFDLVLLDLMLPDGSGYTVCTAIKRENDTPVLFLTASGDEMSVVTGLDLGADDYLTKPFRPMELISRIKNLLRRYGKAQAVFETGSLRIDTVRGTVQKNGQDVFLSALEYRLLLVFVGNRGQVLSRAKLLEDIWDIAGEFVNDNTLTVYIKRLRDKIEDDPQNPAIIKTVRGLGYRMD